MTEQELLTAFAALDTASQEETAQLLEQIDAAESSIATAGEELNSQIAAAEATLQPAIDEYNANVETAQTRADAAQASADQAQAVDATDEIAAISAISAPTVTGTEIADIQAAFDALVSAVNTQITNIKAALTSLNNPEAIGHLKAAAGDLATSNNAIIAAALPPAVDPQPEMDAAFAQIEGLL
ncbi:MAG: hypothetical protein HY231_23875 [Acidobacteria bacterium]|nr:hypothetical protein [Acidobacteriota bacterium]